MEKTIKIYDEDAYVKEFKAKVISCKKDGDKYKIVLDKTAFFPEGGGQSSDKGMIGEVKIIDVQEKDEVIYHYAEEKVEEGGKAHCVIDWEGRYDKMQNHSAEHIISGLIHNKFGYTNVGFHLSDTSEVTFDLDGPIKDEEIKEIEEEANRIVAENVQITANFYSGDDLKDIDYRAKLDLTENVRIVRVGGYDACACCAPHVKSTIEIGLIKILKAESYKGGVRLHMVAGKRAYEDYVKKNEILDNFMQILSANSDNINDKFAKKLEEIDKAKEETAKLKAKVADLVIASVDLSKEKILLIEDNFDMNDLREIGNKLMEKTEKIISLFSNQGDKYSYVICSSKEDIRDFVKELNEKLNGKGGGKPNMIQGSVVTTLEEIEKYYKA